MAQSGIDTPPQGDAAPKISGQRARQGQNIKGMLMVLIVGTLLVAIAYAVMLALQAEPNAVLDERTATPAANEFSSGAPNTTDPNTTGPTTPMPQGPEQASPATQPQ